MAKRNRGPNRPGQRPARPQSRPASRPAGSLSSDDEARAADLEKQIVDRERAAEAARGRSRVAEPVRGTRVSGPGLLATKAVAEYAYVVRDVRRIVVVAAALAAIMAVLYVLVDVAKVVVIS